MAQEGPHRAVLRAVDRARPDRVAQVLADAVAQELGATGVRVLLADYQLAALRPISAAGATEALDDSAAGAAFTTQEPVVTAGPAGGTLVHLPVSVGGDRVGVLQVALPGAASASQVDELGDLATLAGYALHATSRQTDLLHRVARSQRMTLAAELQWQLLPARGCVTPDVEVAGHLEPAYAVYADSFDWSENDGRLQVSISDAATHARSTPLLTTLAVTAARNARRAGLPLADQAALADQAVYAHYQGAHSVGTVMVSIDLGTGRAAVLRAGTPELVLLRDGVPHPVELAEQMPLGMFEGAEYATQTVDLATGDRLLLVSDGVLAALADGGGPPAHGRLREILDAAADHPPARVVRTLIDTLTERSADHGLDDDATVVCLDWRGPGPAGPAVTAPEVGAEGHPPHLRAVTD